MRAIRATSAPMSWRTWRSRNCARARPAEPLAPSPPAWRAATKARCRGLAPTSRVRTLEPGANPRMRGREAANAGSAGVLARGLARLSCGGDVVDDARDVLHAGDQRTVEWPVVLRQLLGVG